jgi:hypothetical protein
MTTKRTPKKDPREFAAYVRAMKKHQHLCFMACYEAFAALMFRAGVAHGRRERSKAK